METLPLESFDYIAGMLAGDGEEVTENVEVPVPAPDVSPLLYSHAYLCTALLFAVIGAICAGYVFKGVR